ncbi:MAG: cytochrome P450 [Acidobacteriota bacterium]
MIPPMAGASTPIPALRGSPLLGHLRQWRRDPLAFLRELSELTSEITQVRFGPRWVYILRHPDLVEHVLWENHKNYRKQTRGYQKLRHVLGDGLLTSEPPFWLRQRRIAQPAFHRDRIAGFGSVFANATLQMLERWEGAAARREPVDVAVEMMRVTLRIVGETLLSTDVSSDAAEVGRALTTVLSHTIASITSIVPWKDKLPTPANFRFREALASLDRVVLGIIAERRRDPTAKSDLLAMLMNARDEETGESMSDRQLRDEVMTIFLAGHETTANALAWTIYLLSRHPDARSALEAEVDGAVTGSAPALPELPSLALTEMTLKEAMRLYPPAWIVGRSAIADDTLSGHTVPAGSFCFMSSYLTHRHPAFWPDPERFDPSRFAPEKVARTHRGAYFPFGGGPRLCIGNSFAMMEAKVILGAIVKRFRLELVPGHPVVPLPMITLRPRHGLPMTLSARG